MKVYVNEPWILLKMFGENFFISLPSPHKKEVVMKFLYFLQLSCLLSKHCQEFNSFGSEVFIVAFFDFGTHQLFQC